MLIKPGKHDNGKYYINMPAGVPATASDATIRSIINRSKRLVKCRSMNQLRNALITFVAFITFFLEFLIQAGILNGTRFFQDSSTGQNVLYFGLLFIAYTAAYFTVRFLWRAYVAYLEYRYISMIRDEFDQGNVIVVRD